MPSGAQSLAFSKKTRVYILFLTVLFLFFSGLAVFLHWDSQKVEAHQSEWGLVAYEKTLDEVLEGRLSTIQENSLLPVSEHSNPQKEQKPRKMFVTITGYSSTEDQTDSSPFLTASPIFL